MGRLMPGAPAGPVQAETLALDLAGCLADRTWSPPRLDLPDQNTYLVACPAGDHRAGIAPSDGHLVYRPHTARTIAGPGFQCSASGRRTCELVPPTRPDARCHHTPNHVVPEGV